MNTSKNDRCPDALLRVRRRNSFSRPAPQVTHNVAAQRRASLLKNNKNLAVSLQETRCELSAYKNFFDESLDFLNKAKLAKSRIAQLSSAFKNFVKALDENLGLLDFDESKWLNFKPSPQSRKIFPNIIPISEVVGEVSEEVSVDHEMNSEDGSCSNSSDQMIAKEKSNGPKTVSKSPQKKSEDFVKNKNLGSSHQTGDAEGCVPTTSRTDVPKTSDLNSLQNPFPAASLSTQAVKVTKIPRCQNLSVTLKRQNFVREPQNKAYKRKLPEKICEESDPNFSRRKTYVVKDRNVLTVTSYTKILPDENESRSLSQETSNISQDRLISKNDKRQTFVIKAKNVSEETEPATNLNSTINKELLTESRVNVDETRLVQEGILKSKRKTFVKKPLLHPNDELECHVRFSNAPCTSVNSEQVSAVTENHGNSKVSENLKSSPNLQLNRERSETDHAAVQSKSVSAENSKNVEHTANFTSPVTNIRSGSFSKESLSGSKATEEIPENLKSKRDSFIPAHIATKVADVVTKRFTFTSYSEVDETTNKVSGDTSPIKTRKSFLESSGSDCEVMMIEELVDFSAIKPPLQVTPIRRQITNKKKRKFAFDGKKRKTVVEKKSQCEIINSDEIVDSDEICENGSQKNAEVCQSGSGANNDNEVNKINEADAAHIVSEEVVNKDATHIVSEEIVNKDATHIVSEEIVNRDDVNNIAFDACAVRKKSTKGPKKMKDNQSTSAKNNKGKKASKAQNGTKKKNPSASIEMDALNRLAKKVKKRNVKKNEHSCFDDNAISKFEEIRKSTKVNKVKVAEKEPESDFSCEKIGVNTFRVQAEIHPPPPSSLNMPCSEDLNKENEKLNLKVAVVLDDIFKSKNIELLNINDKDLISGRAVSLKSPLSASSSNFAIDPEESIEKLRCDLAQSIDVYDLDTDVVIDITNDDLQSDPVSDIEILEIPRRRGKKVNYKEKPLNRKMRRS